MNLAACDQHDIEIQEMAIKQTLAEKYRKDLYTFIKTGLGYDKLSEATHRPICEMLQSETKKKLVVMPRGTFKSTICSISFPIWLLLNDPNHRILLDSELFTNSSRLLREITAHLESKHLIDLYGEFKTNNIWNQTEIVINQRTKVYKEPSIICSGVGAGKTGQHYSVIIADDLNSLENSMSADQREKILNHYRLYFSLLEPGGVIVVVATRYAAGDLVGFILDNEVDKDQIKGLVY